MPPRLIALLCALSVGFAAAEARAQISYDGGEESELYIRFFGESEKGGQQRLRFELNPMNDNEEWTEELRVARGGWLLGRVVGYEKEGLNETAVLTEPGPTGSVTKLRLFKSMYVRASRATFHLTGHEEIWAEASPNETFTLGAHRITFVKLGAQTATVKIDDGEAPVELPLSPLGKIRVRSSNLRDRLERSDAMLQELSWGASWKECAVWIGTCVLVGALSVAYAGMVHFQLRSERFVHPAEQRQLRRLLRRRGQKGASGGGLSEKPGLGS